MGRAGSTGQFGNGDFAVTNGNLGMDCFVGSLTSDGWNACHLELTDNMAPWWNLWYSPAAGAMQEFTGQLPGSSNQPAKISSITIASYSAMYNVATITEANSFATTNEVEIVGPLGTLGTQLIGNNYQVLTPGLSSTQFEIFVPVWFTTGTESESAGGYAVTASPLTNRLGGWLLPPSSTIPLTSDNAAAGGFQHLIQIPSVMGCADGWDHNPCELSRTTYGVTKTAQTASITATSVTLPPYVGAMANSNWEVTATLCTTTAGSAGTATVTLNAYGSSNAVTSSSLALNYFGCQSLALTFVQKGATADTYQYSTTVTGATGSPQYSLTIGVTEHY